MTPSEIKELELWQRDLELVQFEKAGSTTGIRRTESALDADRRQRLLGAALKQLREQEAWRDMAGRALMELGFHCIHPKQLMEDYEKLKSSK